MPYPVHLQAYVGKCQREIPKITLPEEFPDPDDELLCSINMVAMKIPVVLDEWRFDLDAIFDEESGKLKYTNHPHTRSPINVTQIQKLDLGSFNRLVRCYKEELKRQQDEAKRLHEAEQKLKEQPKPHSAAEKTGIQAQVVGEVGKMPDDSRRSAISPVSVSEKTGTHAHVVGEDGNLPNDSHPIAISPADCATSVFIPRPIESSSLSRSAGPGVSKSHLNIRVYVLRDESNDAYSLVYGLDTDLFIFGNPENDNQYLNCKEVFKRSNDSTKDIYYTLHPVSKTNDLTKLFQLCIIPVNPSDPHRLEKVERHIKELNEKIYYRKTLIILAVINAIKPGHISELEKFLNQSSLAAEVVSICPVNGDIKDYRDGVFDPLIEQMNKATNIYQDSNARFHFSRASSSVSSASAAPSASVVVATPAVSANPASENLDLNKRLDAALKQQEQDIEIMRRDGKAIQTKLQSNVALLFDAPSKNSPAAIASSASVVPSNPLAQAVDRLPPEIQAAINAGVEAELKRQQELALARFRMEEEQKQATKEQAERQRKAATISAADISGDEQLALKLHRQLNPDSPSQIPGINAAVMGADGDLVDSSRSSVVAASSAAVPSLAASSALAIPSKRELRDYPAAVGLAIERSRAYQGVKDHFGGEINVTLQGYAFYCALDRQAYCLAVMTRTYQIRHIELHVLLDCVEYTDETFRYSTFTQTVNRTLTNHADIYNFTKEPNIIKMLFNGVKEDFIGSAVDRSKLAFVPKPSATSSLAASPAVVSSSSSSSVLATGKPKIDGYNFPTCPDDAIRLAIQNSSLYLGVRNKVDRPEFVPDNGYAFYIHSEMNILCIAYRIKEDVETKTLTMDSLIATTSYVNGKLQLHAVKGGSEKDIEFLTQVLNPLFKGVKTDFNKNLAQGKTTFMTKSFSNWFWGGSSSTNSNSVTNEKSSLSSIKTVEQTIRVCVIGSTPKDLIKRMCKNYTEYSSHVVKKVTDPATATTINYEIQGFLQQERFKFNSLLLSADLYILAIDGSNLEVFDKINNYLEAIANNRPRFRDEKVIIALTQADKACVVDISDLEKTYLNPKSTSRVVGICLVDEKSSFGFNELLAQMNRATRQQTPATAPARSLAP